MTPQTGYLIEGFVRLHFKKRQPTGRQVPDPAGPINARQVTPCHDVKASCDAAP